MPLIEETGDPQCPIVSRFRFKRTAGSPLGYVDVGTYYTLASGQTVAATAGLLSLGIGGFLQPLPARTFGHSWKGLARSTPAPVVLGTRSQHILKISGLWFYGRNVHEIEQMLATMATTLGPYQGDLEQYQQNGVTYYKKWANTYFDSLEHNYDGSEKFVEYTLTFSTINEPAT